MLVALTSMTRCCSVVLSVPSAGRNGRTAYRTKERSREPLYGRRRIGAPEEIRTPDSQIRSASGAKIKPVIRQRLSNQALNLSRRVGRIGPHSTAYGRNHRATRPGRRATYTRPISFRGHAVHALDLRIELRRLVAVGHAVIANDADPPVAQLANVRSCHWHPPYGRFGIQPRREKQ
jgi:hypothetical protein